MKTTNWSERVLGDQTNFEVCKIWPIIFCQKYWRGFRRGAGEEEKYGSVLKRRYKTVKNRTVKNRTVKANSYPYNVKSSF